MQHNLRNYRLGLLVLSLPPGILIMLLLMVAGAGSAMALILFLLVVAGVQIAGHFSLDKRSSWGFFLLKGAFYTLRLLERPLGIGKFSPEQMVISIYGNSSRSEMKGHHPEPGRTLILLPHCLQAHECTHRLTFDLDACTRCGKCTIGGLLDLRDRFGIRMSVASGGTTARKIVERVNPSLILAVACPRDLSHGMLDVYPIPTMGQLNEWRHGECMDTWVDLEQLEKTLQELFAAAPAASGTIP